MVCISPFVVHEKRRRLFFLRLALALAAYFGITYLLYLAPFRFAYGNMLKFFILFLLVIGIVWLCFDIKPKDALFWSTSGYAVQHAVYCLMSIILYFTGGVDTSAAGGVVLDYLLFRTVSYILAAAAAYFILVRPARKNGELADKSPGIVALSLIILCSALVLNEMAANADGDYFQSMNSFAVRVVCRSYSILCCLVTLGLQFTLFRTRKSERDRAIQAYIIEQQKAQYAFSKDVIEQTNIKFHDIRHQLSAMTKLGEEDRRRSLEELRETVDKYSIIINTGNNTLDIILMEKALVCYKRGIKFEYFAEAARDLSFIENTDLYTLFGNALDNAVSGAESSDNGRYIELRIRRENDMIFVHLENDFGGELTFDGGRPVTKKNSRFHGFGTKSMEYIVSKYGGSLQMRADGGVFLLDMVFPVK